VTPPTLDADRFAATLRQQLDADVAALWARRDRLTGVHPDPVVLLLEVGDALADAVVPAARRPEEDAAIPARSGVWGPRVGGLLLPAAVLLGALRHHGRALGGRAEVEAGEVVAGLPALLAEAEERGGPVVVALARGTAFLGPWWAWPGAEAVVPLRASPPARPRGRRRLRPRAHHASTAGRV
jgi:hypothetical protein